MTEIAACRFAVDKVLPRSIENTFVEARKFTSNFRDPQLEHYRNLKRSDITDISFWTEYVWCVYASGFNAVVLSKKFEDILASAGSLDRKVDVRSVVHVFGHVGKAYALCACKDLLLGFGWTTFERTYCSSIDKLEQLPFIGPTTKYHLARNIGFDCVKPDLHLNRLARYFRFKNPLDMCSMLSVVFKERIGVVDFILWSYLSSRGSADLMS